MPVLNKMDLPQADPDNAKAERLFGWKPMFSGKDGLRRGLEQTIDWFRQPENLKAYKSDIYNL